MIEQIRRRLLIGVTVGVVVVVALALLSDAAALGRALRLFDWRLAPAVLGLTLLNYGLRFVKWQYYLRLLDIRDLARRDSLLIFVSGFAMVMTPGKVGEYLKSYLIRQRAGVPMARTMPTVFAERFTDGFAMLILAGVGMTAFRHGWQALALGTALSAAGLLALQRETLMHRVLRWVSATGVGRGRAEALAQLYDSTRTLLRWRPFLTAVGIGIVSWFGECVAFFLVLTGLGLSPSWGLLLAAVFVFAAASWLGAASMLPGGLGAAELSVAGLLILTVDDPLMTSAIAGAATLLIRFATLWFGVLLGVLALSKVSSWGGASVGANAAPEFDGAAPARAGGDMLTGES